MTVVSNASPLILFARAELLDVLEQLFGRVVVPAAVHQEVAGNALRPGAQAILSAPWLGMAALDPPHQARSDMLSDLQLDRGEASAIALAKQLRADLLLMDEERGRRTALALGLSVTGSVGLVLTAWRRALIPDPRQTLRRLMHEGLWLSPHLVQWFDDQVGSRP